MKASRTRVAPAKAKPARQARAAVRPAPPARPARAATRLRAVAPSLCHPLSEGERADALRILTEDRRLAAMAKVARYRVIAVEPLVVKPPHPQFGRRTARVVIYDYASDRSVEAAIDLDGAAIVHLAIGA